MAIFCIPFTFVANLLLNYWPFGETMCPLVNYLQVMSVFLSAYTLVAMSFERYIVIVHPFKPRITTRKTTFVIIIIWILALSIPVPTLLKSKVHYYSNTSGQCLESWDNYTLGYAYSTGIMMLHFFVPLVLLGILLEFSFTRRKTNITKFKKVQYLLFVLPRQVAIAFYFHHSHEEFSSKYYTLFKL
jgi:neuropeptide Y receptor